jgi:phage terminase large subunit GpA-like protein
MNAPAPTDSMRIAHQAWSDAVRPDPAMTVSEWADAKRMLPSSAAAEPGRWRTSRTPYLREIMDDLSPTSTVERVYVMKGTQVGFSEAGLNFVGFVIEHAPGPTLYVLPTVETIKRFSKGRVEPMIEATSALRAKIAPARSRDAGNTMLQKDFPGGTLVLTGANSAVGLRSMPVRYLALDEVDGYPASADEEGDPVNLAIKRTDTFRSRRKIFALSTPLKRETSRIEKMFREGDQRYYHVACKHCDAPQPIIWGQIRYEPDRPESAVFVCRECGGVHEEHDKPRLLSEANGARWVATAPVNGRIRSYHLSALYSPWKTWADCVDEWIKAQRDAALLQVFVNTVLGETWDEIDGEEIDAEGLMLRREDWGDRVPARAALVTAGVDVQPDRLEVELVAWGRDEESWSIDYRVIYGDPNEGQVWQDLTEYLERDLPHASVDDVRVAGVCIDTGGANTQAVYAYCRGKEKRRIWAIKGVSGAKPVWPKRPSKAAKGKVNLYAVGVDTAKETVTLRFANAGEDGPGGFHVPTDRDRTWFDQITAERLRTKYLRGFPVRYWWKPDNRRNEALDCRVYAYAALQGLIAMGVQLNRHAERVERAAALRAEAEQAARAAAAPVPVPAQNDVAAAARRVALRRRGRVAVRSTHV